MRKIRIYLPKHSQDFTGNIAANLEVSGHQPHLYVRIQLDDTHVAPSTVPYLRSRSTQSKYIIWKSRTRSPNTGAYPCHGPSQCSAYPSQRQASTHAQRRLSPCPLRHLQEAEGSHTTSLWTLSTRLRLSRRVRRSKHLLASTGRRISQGLYSQHLRQR